ncbi:hypothetical protein HPC49_21915 [Pyxidicoccus fallax]|uniref:Uncharacterized protein n=1 Tax=Pyxidicoccus fallax TaxID=394095 RepID=A0A848LRA7_9BACT|nr:hypothetical protein [Pyxidicoccus fallax]NMO19994.1 hypothetical protein [Pyxidicoccus fallax]NPC80869.1 hypothetical protein [Pyxidicoccus fallax]
MARNDRVNALLPVEAEFQKEKASGLRRSGDKLEQLLAELARTERELRAQTGADRVRSVTRYRELRKEAEYQKWSLMVQREACGLRNHRDLDLVYPLPPPLRE